MLITRLIKYIVLGIGGEILVLVWWYCSWAPRNTWIMLLFLYILQSKENQRVTLLRGTLIPGDDGLGSVGKIYGKNRCVSELWRKKEKSVLVLLSHSNCKSYSHSVCLVKMEKALNLYNKVFWERDHIHIILLQYVVIIVVFYYYCC